MSSSSVSESLYPVDFTNILRVYSLAYSGKGILHINERSPS
jgi:hypothetical protein